VEEGAGERHWSQGSVHGSIAMKTKLTIQYGIRFGNLSSVGAVACACLCASALLAAQ
jgi:hypothetical protein